MMTLMLVWMGISACTTLGLVSAVGLGVRRHIPTLDTETTSEPMVILNRGTAGGDAKLATSYAR